MALLSGERICPPLVLGSWRLEKGAAEKGRCPRSGWLLGLFVVVEAAVETGVALRWQRRRDLAALEKGAAERGR